MRLTKKMKFGNWSLLPLVVTSMALTFSGLFAHARSLNGFLRRGPVETVKATRCSQLPFRCCVHLCRSEFTIRIDSGGGGGVKHG